MRAVEIVRPGLLTTVQDLGRSGFQRYGVPASGAMDQTSLRAANLLVDNEEGAAGLEATGEGPALRALADLVVAVVGADMQPLLDGRPIESGAAVPVGRGQLLELGPAKWGLRAYVAIAGGIDVPRVLGSRSTCLPAAFGGLQGRPLRSGDLLPVGGTGWPTAPPGGRRLPASWSGPLPDTLTLRVVLGPQDDLFAPEGIETFFNGVYRLMPEMDRMGARLHGPPIAHRTSADIVSDSIPLGAVQVPPDQQPIILLADRQTTGGYAKIAVVVNEDVSRLAQATAGQGIRFRQVSLRDAHIGMKAYEARFLALKHQWHGQVAAASYALRLAGKVVRVSVEERAGGYRVSLDDRKTPVDGTGDGT
jgi:biotin-dependent carboxylase-like uncharacterized protein